MPERHGGYAILYEGNYKKQMQKKVNFYKILCIILAIVLAIVIGIMVYRNYTQNKAGEIYSGLQMQVNSVQPEIIYNEGEEESEIQEETEQEEDILTSLGITIPEKNISFEQLKEINADIYAWIYIPDTKVDYPVLQSADNDEYYLMHNLDGSYGYPGCIFSQMLNERDFRDNNTILYGHNMKDGTMFRTLHYYQNEEFFYNNPYIYIYTENGVLVYQIFAAYNAGDEHILNTYDLITETGYASYIEKIELNARLGGYIRDDILLSTDRRMITLSTCTDKSDERYLVQAVLINDEFGQEDDFGTEDIDFQEDSLPEGADVQEETLTEAAEE